MSPTCLKASLIRSDLSSCVGLILLTVAGCTPKVSETATPAESAKPTAVAVQAAEVALTTLHPTLDLVGSIVAIPEKTAVISPQLGGWVNKLNVVAGQSVVQGDALVDLDTRSAEIALQRAKAVVAEKKAAVDRLKRGYLPEEIAAARQDAANAQATVDGLRNELTALKELLDRNEISSVIYDTKSKALESAEAAMAAAVERAKLLEAGTRPEMIAEAQALLDAAQADVEQAQLALQWCSITSPIDGIVVQLLARQGQFFDKAVPLVKIIDLSAVFVQLRIPSHDFARVTRGSQVEVRLDSLPAQVFPGTIERISGEADPLTGNLVVFALVKNTDQLLRPGLSCHALISLPPIKDALVVPISAVADLSGTPVVTVIRDSKAFETKVVLGTETKEIVQVLHGLTKGDLVATAGGTGLPQGCPVKVVADLSTVMNDAESIEP